MKKVAIVGVEGSGKTVLLAGLGERYAHPDERGYFFEPQTLETASYVRRQCGRLREGKWPAATAPDVMQVLGWTLRKTRGRFKPSKLCEVTCLDFAGEVYLAAFCGKTDSSLSRQVAELRQYVRSATAIVLLVNLRDAIIHGTADARATATEFATLQMLKAIFEDRPSGIRRQRVLIALSQADAFKATIEECGGAKQTFCKYLPMVANSFGWLDVIAVNAVDKTDVTDAGDVIPSKDFSFNGIEPLTQWIIHPPFSWRQTFSDVVTAFYNIRHFAWKQYFSSSKFLIPASLVVEGLLFSWIFVGPGFWRFVRWVLFFAVSFFVGASQLSYADGLRKNEDLRAPSIEKSGLITMVFAAVLTVARFVIWIVRD